MPQEQLPPQIQFEDLSAPQRVEAVLANAMMPSYTRDLALDHAGVRYDQLEDADKQAVDAVFTAPGVQSSIHEKFGMQYAIPQDQQEAVLQRLGIDWQTVTYHIAEIIGERMMRELFDDGF